MAAKPIQSASTPASDALDGADYDVVEAAVLETARGRWFLAEHARRNRQVEGERVLKAIARMTGQRADLAIFGDAERDRGEAETLRGAIAGIQDLIARLRTAIMAGAPADPAIAGTESLAGLADIVRQMRAAAFDRVTCDLFDHHLATLVDLADEAMLQRQSRLLSLVESVERRLARLSGRPGGPPPAPAPGIPAETPPQAAPAPVVAQFDPPMAATIDIAPTIVPEIAETSTPVEQNAAPAAIQPAPAADARSAATQDDAEFEASHSAVASLAEALARLASGLEPLSTSATEAQAVSQDSRDGPPNFEEAVLDEPVALNLEIADDGAIAREAIEAAPAARANDDEADRAAPAFGEPPFSEPVKHPPLGLSDEEEDDDEPLLASDKPFGLPKIAASDLIVPTIRKPVARIRYEIAEIADMKPRERLALFS